MKEKTIEGVTLLPENKLVWSRSVLALSSITMFWQPQMDSNYRPPESSQNQNGHALEQLIACRDRLLAKRGRGEIWKLVNARLSKLGLPNTKANRDAIYNQLAEQNPAKIEESL